MSKKTFAIEFKNEEEKIYKIMSEKDSIIYLQDEEKFYDIFLQKRITQMWVRLHYWYSKLKIFNMVKDGTIPTFKWLCRDKWWIEWYYNLVK